MSFCSCRGYPSEIKVSSSCCSNTTVVVSAVLGVNGTKSLRVNSIKKEKLHFLNNKIYICGFYYRMGTIK